MSNNNRYRILIVDDSQMNRMILSDILSEKFDIIEASDGIEAVSIIKKQQSDISLILLDLVMPHMDGFEVLKVMNQGKWIEDIPVIMISAENSEEYIEHAYDLGVTDFINRPFNVSLVQRRVANTIMLYAKQKNLVKLVTDQVYEKEKNNHILVNVLSHIVEFRNGESHMHVLNINLITDILLKQLMKKSDRYVISPNEISMIVTASSLHDIGKIAIPDKILNKPGKLTPEEFEVIKTHSKAGADMLDAIPEFSDEPLVKIAHDICLYHHERYDGKGYPFGLKGDEIPISAQIVSVADVYDALTSERCYKPPFTHEKAIDMITNGECGAFNPLIIECLLEISDTLRTKIRQNSFEDRNAQNVKYVAEEILSDDRFSSAKKSINLLEQARIKYEFFASMSHEIQFEYTCSPSMLTISEWSADMFGLPTVMLNPFKNEKINSIISVEEVLKTFTENMNKTSVDDPIVTFDIQIMVNDELRWHRVYSRVNWSLEDKPEIVGTIGKIIDVEDTYRMRARLEKKATMDTLTNLHNKGYSKELVSSLLKNNESNKYALALFDLDNFKSANDTYGHMFGDKVLKTVSSKLLSVIRKDDIVARIGGDEFLLFIEYNNKLDLVKIAKRIFGALNGIVCDDYTIKISMGVATTEDAGYAHDDLFVCADTALYHTKRHGRGALSFYEKSMELINGEITPIET